MAIRLRQVQNEWVALCAAETDAKEKDIYLDDSLAYALMLKMCRDYQGQLIDWRDERNDQLAATQKVRDAKQTLIEWLERQEHDVLARRY